MSISTRTFKWWTRTVRTGLDVNSQVQRCWVRVLWYRVQVRCVKSPSPDSSPTTLWNRFGISESFIWSQVLKSFPQKTGIEELIESKIKTGTFHIYLNTPLEYTGMLHPPTTLRPLSLWKKFSFERKFSSKWKRCYTIFNTQGHRGEIYSKEPGNEVEKHSASEKL
jgi:hypothetical protein